MKLRLPGPSTAPGDSCSVSIETLEVLEPTTTLPTSVPSPQRESPRPRLESGLGWA